MIGLLCFVLAVLASPFKSKLRLEAENAVLRHQLNVVRRRLSGRVRLANNDVPFGFEGGKALEAIGGAGHTAKTAMVFTRMDEVKGPNIKGWEAKRDYSFSGVRNVVDNQIAKSLTPDVARFMLSHLENNAFYLGALQKGDPVAAKVELSLLLDYLTEIVPPRAPAPAFPDYGTYDLLVLALQKGAEDFRVPWRAYLSIQRHSGHPRSTLTDFGDLIPALNDQKKSRST
jgi:hypothetical protein